jgi:hypothetical protein
MMRPGTGLASVNRRLQCGKCTDVVLIKALALMLVHDRVHDLSFAPHE